MSAAAALPADLFFDLVSTEEVDAAHELEIQGKLASLLLNAL